jgi:23S rRNA (uridine2552-2'-O)-methyltransferase
MNRRNAGRNSWEDHYTRQARKENYPARSVFKLQEIQQKTRILRPGFKVLDLGCYPGSWLLYAAEQVGERGHVLGVDLTKMEEALPANTQAVVGDLLQMSPSLRETIGKGYHVVLSDMAPSTTGNRGVDSARSTELCRAGLALALDVLNPGGTFVCKIFQGDEFEDFLTGINRRFSQMKILKPQSSRKASKEIFVIGLGMQ